MMPTLGTASQVTGLISMVLLTAVVVLGVLVNRQGRLPGLPSFAGLSLHRYLSLLAVGFLTVHIVTAVADPFAGIRLAATVIPFASAYKPAGLAGPGRSLLRPDGRPDHDQPAAASHRPPGLARSALAGLRVLAGCAGAQHRLQL
jgi:hypothetical protein